MKRITTTIAVLALFFIVSAFNLPETQVAAPVKLSFQRTYASIKNVEWQRLDNMYIASFNLDGSDVCTAYSEQGELIALTRKVNMDNLPLCISNSLKQKFGGLHYNVQATEVQVDGETYYTIDGQDDKKFIRIKCRMSGETEILKRIKK